MLKIVPYETLLGTVQAMTDRLREHALKNNHRDSELMCAGMQLQLDIERAPEANMDWVEQTHSRRAADLMRAESEGIKL